MCLVYFASEVVSMEVEQAHFDEFFEVRMLTTHIQYILQNVSNSVITGCIS